MHSCIYLCELCVCAGYQLMPEEHFDYLDLDLTVDCELPDMGSGGSTYLLRSFARVASTFNSEPSLQLLLDF